MTDADMNWLRELQEDVRSWSLEQFGVSPLHGGDGTGPNQTVIGVGEELGELSRSVLKRSQSIDDSDKYAERDDVGPDAERDAIGDITIYLLDTAHRADDDLSVADGWEYVSHRPDMFAHIDDAVDMTRMCYSWYGELVGLRFELHSADDELDPVEHKMGELVHALQQFCEIRGYDYQQCVEGAWSDVSDRNWSAGGDE
jgi:hypothetical protein